MDVMDGRPKGIIIINSILREVHKLISPNISSNSELFKNIVIDFTELLKDEYSRNINDFKTLTSNVGLSILVSEGFNHRTNEVVIENLAAKAYVIPRGETMQSINMYDLLNLQGIDLNDYEVLSKCEFLLNNSSYIKNFDLPHFTVKW